MRQFARTTDATTPLEPTHHYAPPQHTVAHNSHRFSRTTAPLVPIHTTLSTPNTTLLSRPTTHQQHFHSPWRTSSRLPSTHLHPRPSSTHSLATRSPRPSSLATMRPPHTLPHTTPYVTRTPHLLYLLRYATRYATPTPLETAHTTLRPFQPRYATLTSLATAPATRYATPTPLAAAHATLRSYPPCNATRHYTTPTLLASNICHTHSHHTHAPDSLCHSIASSDYRIPTPYHHTHAPDSLRNSDASSNPTHHTHTPTLLYTV
ncbi:hypothetical protein Pcinc_010873 [Petrolisthes cinctipes]|uniref:Uncharacterized protein n=1 Tax=Petrolisthes cinctipes TaxID=88211 RepID=A0AAE1G442_PETCI|nr:hypothetical protein Pcinc_010873 [Petrolisthes cinctipes]